MQHVNLYKLITRI